MGVFLLCKTKLIFICSDDMTSSNFLLEIRTKALSYIRAIHPSEIRFCILFLKKQNYVVFSASHTKTSYDEFEFPIRNPNKSTILYSCYSPIGDSILHFVSQKAKLRRFFRFAYKNFL